MSLKVLIADPDWRFAGQAAKYLESHAHLVVHETRVKEAIAHAEHWRPDLVIMSADLANKGLMEPVTALRPRPAVLLIGWMDRYDLAWKAWQKGGDELLIKPVFRIQELHEAIVTALENATTGVRTVPAAATA
ncbi:MAG TPA: response regulator [Phycisphaerae bacterium]|nr:response regulator [Phycisphaerae bacterium]